MRGEWIVREGRPDLLLFFNGWGMDRRVADRLLASSPDLVSHDLVVLCDYRELRLPAGLEDYMARYRAVDLVAWSLGVWAARNAGLGRIRRAVALNGTPFPIDPVRGILPEIFSGTLDHWCDATRSRFERRMFGGVDGDDRIGQVRSARSSSDQQEELRAIAAAVPLSGERQAPSWSYSKALIGGKDQIFLPGNQRTAWADTTVVMVDAMPHFPFFHLDGWAEVLS